METRNGGVIGREFWRGWIYVMLEMAQLISYGLGIYVLLGLLFGLYFITRGLRNEAITGKGIILRLMLLPGAILIWPLLLRKKP